MLHQLHHFPPFELMKHHHLLSQPSTLQVLCISEPQKKAATRHGYVYSHVVSLVQFILSLYKTCQLRHSFEHSNVSLPDVDCLEEFCLTMQKHSRQQPPDVKSYLLQAGVEWCFNLEKAPRWGGVFERLVKSTKRCLRKVLGQLRFSRDEMYTALVDSVIRKRR